MKATTWAIIVIVMTGMLSLILTIIFIPDAIKTDPYARYALATHVLVALMLGVYFFYLQKRDSDKLQGVVDHLNNVVADQSKLVGRIDEVVRISAEMAAEERARAERRKRYCLGIMKGSINDIAQIHETMRAELTRLLEQEVTDDARKSYAELIQMDRDWTRRVGIPRLDNAVSQISDLLEDPYLSTYGKDEPESVFSGLLDPNIVYSKHEAIITHIKEIAMRKQTFQFFLNYIDREMPYQTKT